MWYFRIFSFILFLCIINMYTWGNVSMSTCLDMWRPEAGVKYLALSLSTMCFKTGSLPEPGAHQLNRLAICQRTCQSPPQLPNYRQKSPCLSFCCHCCSEHGYCGSRLRSSHLYSKNFTPELPPPGCTVIVEYIHALYNDKSGHLACPSTVTSIHHFLYEHHIPSSYLYYSQMYIPEQISETGKQRQELGQFKLHVGCKDTSLCSTNLYSEYS